ncbi:MAG TPA: aldehyde dehydrogenase family protein [Fimbriimonadaceae bacterium]|nr:aldehyde dehydrogenase family protein [Fimbriimonadaceae bacterium]
MSVSEIFESLEYGPAPEGAAIVEEWLDRHERRFGFFIGGKWIKASQHFDTYSPRDGSVLAHVGQGSDADVDKAVKAARKAQADWAAGDGQVRARVLYALARLVQKHARLFAVLESVDNGKPIRETRDLDIPLVARHFAYHAGWAALQGTELSEFEPVGVCGQIIPWNFPLLMLAWKIAPAIAVGNTVVLKPAEFTSLTALLFAELCGTAGVPAGVVNIITGDGETGKALVDHPGVDKIAFTGSTEVGRSIRVATANTPKKLSLELGGKSPFIVFEDADLDGAVEGLVDAIWFNQGQVCCAGSRLLVQEGVADEVIAKVRRRMETLRVGDPLDKAIDIGAIVAPVQLERIRALVDQGVAEGATLHQPAGACPTDGWYYPPTLLTGVEPASMVAQVEIFGPVVVAMTFRTPAEAVALANNTPYGLAASVWSDNLNVSLEIARKVKAGTVWVNCSNLFDAASGFGGYGESGYGREGGREGLLEYLKPKRTPIREPYVAVPPTPNDGTIDRTHKLFIGGKQVRPDGGYSLQYDAVDIARGNRKDIRNAVEAARGAAAGWAATSGYARSQILYYLAENLDGVRHDLPVSEREMEASIRRLFEWAAWADKFDGQVHDVPLRGMTYTWNEAIGVVGIVCSPEAPLLGLLTLAGAAMAMGNAVVAVPSVLDPIPGVELYRILDASDFPAGVFNIVTGLHEELVPTLADHDDVDAIWAFGAPELGTDVRRRSAGNLKQAWVETEPFDWADGDLRMLLRHATQVKNVWVPIGS